MIAFPKKKSKKEVKKKKEKKDDESSFLKKKDLVICQYCGYKIIPPYPEDKLCPGCGKFVPDLYPYQNANEDEEQKIVKEFDKRSATPSQKFGSKVRVKEKNDLKFSLSDDFIPLQQNSEYLRFLGITTKEGRNKLFFSNDRFKYLLELANNLDYIATSILGGELDKMLLISKEDVKEKCQFLVKDNLIYVVFGNFPDKKGKWILEQMAKYYSDLIKDLLYNVINIELNKPAEEEIKKVYELEEVDKIIEERKMEKYKIFVKGNPHNLILQLTKLFGNRLFSLMKTKVSLSELIQNGLEDVLTEAERSEIARKFEGPATFIINEYKGLQEVFTDKEIPYLEDWMRVDYLGLSSMSIGVISLLLDSDGKLNVEVPGEFEDQFEEIEMKESLLTAKIEAIAANTLGNTGSYPRWIAVKLGFQLYRFLTFRKYQNDYFLSLLSEGNLQKLDKVEGTIEPYLYHGIDKPFSGNLRPFNKLKATIREIFNNFSDHKIN